MVSKIKKESLSVRSISPQNAIKKVYNDYNPCLNASEKIKYVRKLKEQPIKVIETMDDR